MRKVYKFSDLLGEICHARNTIYKMFTEGRREREGERFSADEISNETVVQAMHFRSFLNFVILQQAISYSVFNIAYRSKFVLTLKEYIIIT